MKRQIFTLTIVFLLSLTLAAPTFAVDESELSKKELEGIPADDLTITVGYFGGPYYEKKVFTLEELWAMDVQYQDYTMIDGMPAAVIDHVAGVTLADIVDAAGIDLGSVQNFNFWCTDKQSDYYVTLTKKYLIDTPRYCYYSLPDNWDYDEGRGNEYAALDAVRVPTVLALGDYFLRAQEGATFGSDYQNLNTNTRFRLVFGQTNASEHTASNSAKWIHRIEITLGGAPTVTLTDFDLDLEVGSQFRSEPIISAADPVIAANTTVEWSSSDERIASVDADGNITVHAEGTATITAKVGDSVATLIVNGVPGEKIDGVAIASPNPAVDGSTGGTPDGTGTSGGTGTPGETSDSPAESTAKPQPSAQPVIPSEPIVIKDTITGYEIRPAAKSESSDNGGVQQWRDDEMADTAVELPIIPEDNAMVPVMVWGSLAFLIVGGGVEFMIFKKQVGG
jgi:hypothetical protein